MQRHLPGNKVLEGRTADGIVSLAKDDYSGTQWELYEEPGGDVVRLKCRNTTEGPRWLHGSTANGTVGLAPETGGHYTGTKWTFIALG